MSSHASRALFVSLALTACGAATPGARVPARELGWTRLESPTTESLRGLSAASERVVWASGAHGTVLRSIDGGERWTLASVDDAEALDLRSLHAFDEDRAVVFAAGAPARAFRTEDGGAHWTETFTRDVPGIFFDSIAFWDEREGIAIGDPLATTDGARFAALVTHDGGASWEDREGPLAIDGEAAFAASNGVIALPSRGVVVFASNAHVFRSDGGEWERADASVPSSESSGVFAIALDGERGYAVGGDYAEPSAAGSFARSADGGRTWSSAGALAGYRSSIAIGPDSLLVVGTTGSELSRDDGMTWTSLGHEALNTVRVVGRTAFAVGPDGTIARLSLVDELSRGDER